MPDPSEDRLAIVVLGAAVWPGGIASPALARRIAEGARQAHAHPTAIVIASGGLGRHAPTEAEVIRRDLIAAGLAPARILLEGRSTTTMENAAHSIGLMRAHGLARALIVTDGYHLPRAGLTFRKLGTPAQGRAARRDRPLPVRKRLWAWTREAIALPAYWLRLTLRRG